MLKAVEKDTTKYNVNTALTIIRSQEGKLLENLYNKKNQARQLQQEKQGGILQAKQLQQEKIIHKTQSINIKKEQHSKTKKLIHKEDAKTERKQSTYNVRWSDVEFCNGHLNVRYDGMKIQVHCGRSIEQFNRLKMSLEIFKNTFLSVKYDFPTDSFKLNSYAVIDQIFDRLEIEHCLSNVDIDDSQYLVRMFLSRWSNQRLLNAYNIINRTLYLGHLCELYSKSLRIVPVKEKRQNESNGGMVEEDAFLFPVHNYQWLYILWESVEEKRATYIFRCQSTDYSIALQKIFDYIASPHITNKRDRLRQGDVGYFKGPTVEYYKSLNHDDLNDWKRRLDEICR